MLKFARLFALLVTLTFLMVASPTAAQEDCPGVLPSRLVVGQQGRVTPGDPNNVRSLPSTSGDRLGQIPAGGVFTVLDGPACAEGYAWWLVDFEGLMGWTVEATATEYWLEPIAVPPTPTQNATPTPVNNPSQAVPTTGTPPISLSQRVPPVAFGEARISPVNADQLEISGTPTYNLHHAFASTGVVYYDGQFWSSWSATQPLRETPASSSIPRNYDRTAAYAPRFTADGQFAFQPILDFINGSAVLVYRIGQDDFELIAAFEVQGDPTIFDLSPDGKRFLTGDRNAQEPLTVYDATTGALLYQIPAPELIHEATFSPDGRYIVVNSLHTSLIEAATGAVVQEINGDNFRFTSTTDAAFSMDGTRLYASSASDVYVFDTSTWTEITRFSFYDEQFADLDCVAYEGITLSPDGRLLVSLGVGGDVAYICLWEAQGGTVVAGYALPEIETPNLSVSFSPDMSVLLVEGYVLQLPDPAASAAVPVAETVLGLVPFTRANIEDLTTLLSLPGHQIAAQHLVFLPDGTSLVSSGDDGVLRLWNAQDGTLSAELDLDPALPVDPIVGLAVNTKGDQALVGNRSGTLWRVDLPTMTVVNTTTLTLGIRDFVKAIAFAPDGGSALIGIRGALMATEVAAPLYQWSFADNSLTPLPTDLVGISDLVYSPDARYLALGEFGSAARVQIVDSRTGEVLHDFSMQRDGSSTEGDTFLAFTADSNALFAVRHGQPPVKYDLAAARLVAEWAEAPSVFSEVVVAPDGSFFFTGVALFDAFAPGSDPFFDMVGVDNLTFAPDGLRAAVTNEEVIHILGVYGPVEAVAGSDAVGSQSQGIAAYLEAPRPPLPSVPLAPAAISASTVTDLVERATFRLDTSADQYVQFSADNRWLMTVGGGLRVYDALTLERVLEINAFEGEFSADGRRLLVETNVAGVFTAEVYDTATWEKLAAFTLDDGSNAPNTAINADGSVVALSGQGAIALFNVSSAVQIALLQGQPRADDIKFSPNGCLLVSVGLDSSTGRERANLVRLWDTTTGTLVTELEGHNADVYLSVFSPDGKLLVTIDRQQAIRLWDMTNGAPVNLLGDHSQGILAATFTPDGAYLVTAAQDSTLRVWDLRVPAAPQLLVYALDNFRFEFGLTTGSVYPQQTALGGVFALSPDGKLLAYPDANNNVHIVDTATGTHLATYSGAVHPVDSLAFSPDGALLVAAGSPPSAPLAMTDAARAEVRVWAVE